MVGDARLWRRMIVIGALVGLTTWVGAAPLSAGLGDQPAKDATTQKEGAAEVQGVGVPGLTVSKVSGEAFGGQVTLTLRGLFGGDGAATALATPGGPGSDFAQQILHDAAAAAGSGSGLTVTVHGSAGPDPEVELPGNGGGPIVDDEGQLIFTYDVSSTPRSFPIAHDLKVETQGAVGDAGYSHTEAKAEDVIGFFPDMHQIDSECGADLTGVRGTTEVDDGTYADFDSTGHFIATKHMPDHPDANEELVDLDFHVVDGSFDTHIEYSVVLNEQDTDAHAITVTGYHESLHERQVDTSLPGAPTVATFDFEARFAQSHCDVHADPVAPVVEPTFTG
jgi:hypothetical protein